MLSPCRLGDFCAPWVAGNCYYNYRFLFLLFFGVDFCCFLGKIFCFLDVWGTFVSFVRVVIIITTHLILLFFGVNFCCFLGRIFSFLALWRIFVGVIIFIITHFYFCCFV